MERTGQQISRQGMSDKLLKIVLGVVDFLNNIAAVAICFLMCITVFDVVLRTLGHPILGSNEMVALSGSIVIGFSVPLTSWYRRHVYIEFMGHVLKGKAKTVLNLSTRVICFFLFAFLAINLFSVGAEFHKSGEVSSTLQIPFYPFPYAIGVCCFVQCLVFFCDIVKIWGGKYE